MFGLLVAFAFLGPQKPTLWVSFWETGPYRICQSLCQKYFTRNCHYGREILYDCWKNYSDIKHFIQINCHSSLVVNINIVWEPGSIHTHVCLYVECLCVPRFQYPDTNFYAPLRIRKKEVSAYEESISSLGINQFSCLE